MKEIEFKNGGWIDQNGNHFDGIPEVDLEIGDSFTLRVIGMRIKYTIEKKENINGHLKVTSKGKIIEGNLPFVEPMEEKPKEEIIEKVKKPFWRWFKK